MISHFLRASGNQISYDDMRIGEMKICRFYDWNISMMTFYDFLEQFLAQGTLFEDDVILLNGDNSDHIKNSGRDFTPDNKIKGPGEKAQSPYYTPSPQESQLLRLGLRGNSRSPQPSHNNDAHKTPGRFIRAKELELSNRNVFIENLASSALQIAHQIGKQYLTNTWRQRDIAYMIVVMARQANNMKLPDQSIYKELYKIQNHVDFNQIAIQRLKDFEILSVDKFDFDPVERQYDSEGNLISNFGKKKKKKKKRNVYKGKVVLQNQSNHSLNQVSLPNQNLQMATFGDTSVQQAHPTHSRQALNLKHAIPQSTHIQSSKVSSSNLLKSEFTTSGIVLQQKALTNRSLLHSGLDINNSALNYSNSGVVNVPHNHRNSSSKLEDNTIFSSKLKSQITNSQIVDVTTSQIDLNHSNPHFNHQQTNQKQTQQRISGIVDRGNMPNQNSNLIKSNLSNQSNIPQEIIDKYVANHSLKTSALTNSNLPLTKQQKMLNNYSSVPVQPDNRTLIDFKNGNVTERTRNNSNQVMPRKKSTSKFSDAAKLQFGGSKMNPSILKTNYFDLKNSTLTRKSNPNQKNVFIKFHPEDKPSEKAKPERKQRNEKISIDGAVNKSRGLNERSYSVNTLQPSGNTQRTFTTQNNFMSQLKFGQKQDLIESRRRESFDPKMLSQRSNTHAINTSSNTFNKNLKNMKRFEIQAEKKDEVKRPIFARVQSHNELHLNGLDSRNNSNYISSRNQNLNFSESRRVANQQKTKTLHTKGRTYSQNPMPQYKAQEPTTGPVLQTSGLNYMSHHQLNNRKIQSTTNASSNGKVLNRTNPQNYSSNLISQNHVRPILYSHRDALTNLQNQIKSQKIGSESSRLEYQNADSNRGNRLSDFRTSHHQVIDAQNRINNTSNNTPLKYDMIPRKSEALPQTNQHRNLHKTQSQVNILNLKSNNPMDGNVSKNGGYIESANAMFNKKRTYTDINSSSIAEYGTFKKPSTPHQFNFYPQKNSSIILKDGYTKKNTNAHAYSRNSGFKRVDPPHTAYGQQTKPATNNPLKSGSAFQNLKQGVDHLINSHNNKPMKRDDSLLSRRYLNNSGIQSNQQLSHRNVNTKPKIMNRDLSIGSMIGANTNRKSNYLTLNHSNLAYQSRRALDIQTNRPSKISQNYINTPVNKSGLSRINSVPVFDPNHDNRRQTNHIRGKPLSNYPKFGTNQLDQPVGRSQNQSAHGVNQYGLSLSKPALANAYTPSNTQGRHLYNQTMNIASKRQLEQNINRVKNNITNFQ